ncbi:MAG: hypothetical protein AAGA48_21925 [Myxococcota bacterium]
MTKRTLGFLQGSVVGALAVLFIPFVATALTPKTFERGDPIRAADMQEMWDAIRSLQAASLVERIGVLETRDLGRFCGLTELGPAGPDQGISGDAVQGYDGARTLCAAAQGCSADAHMCLGAEIVMSYADQIPVTFEGGWYAGAAWEQAANGNLNNDCSGYTSSANEGSRWGPGVGPSRDVCTNLHEVMCCD